MKNHAKWLQQNACSLSGKTVLITGGNSGIGYAAAAHFLSLGADLILACRSEARGKAAQDALAARFPHQTVTTELLDLSSYASMDAFAQRIRERYAKIHILLHCAGVYYPKECRTADGLPMTVGVNYAGTVRLTEALLPQMDSTGRVIFTTSLVDRFGRVRKSPAARSREGYPDYAESKLLLSAYALKKAAERDENSPAFIAAHPGITATSLLDPAKTSHSPLLSRLGHDFLYLFTHSKEKAALTAVYAACKGKNGECIGPRGLFGISGYPHVTGFCGNVKRQAAKGIDPYIPQ